MRKISVILAVLVIGMLSAGIWFQNKDKWFPLEEQIAARIAPNDPDCTDKNGAPLLVVLENRSSQTLDWVGYEISVRRSGHPSILKSQEFHDDLIMQSGDRADYCVARPGDPAVDPLSMGLRNPYVEFPAEELEYTIEVIDVDASDD